MRGRRRRAPRFGGLIPTVARGASEGASLDLSPHAGGELRLRNDVRRELVLNKCDAVAQIQLALFQTLDLNQVGAERYFERRNRGIEVAMLLLQTRKLHPKLAFFLLCHCRLGRLFGTVLGRYVAIDYCVIVNARQWGFSRRRKCSKLEIVSLA
jgi:hypothetical protein